MFNFKMLTFDELKVGDYFTLPYHIREYVKISKYFARDIIHEEVFQFAGHEKVYKEKR